MVPVRKFSSVFVRFNSSKPASVLEKKLRSNDEVYREWVQLKEAMGTSGYNTNMSAWKQIKMIFDTDLRGRMAKFAATMKQQKVELSAEEKKLVFDAMMRNSEKK